MFNLPKPGTVLRVRKVDLTNFRYLIIINLFFPLKEIVMYSSTKDAIANRFAIDRAEIYSPFIFLGANVECNAIKIFLNNRIGWINAIGFDNIWQDIFEELK